jgi:hypothetical protein
MKTELMDGRIEETIVDGDTVTKNYYTKNSDGDYCRNDEILDISDVAWLTDEDRAAHTAQKEQERINSDSLAYLASTDWYIIRLQETAKPIPQEILDNRQAARDAIVV